MSLHFILDGYNLIKQNERLAFLKLQDARDVFLARIKAQNLQGSAKNSVTVVFDGQLETNRQWYSPGIEVVYTGGETADEWIKRFVEDCQRPKNLVVVTDDREIRCFVKSLGASVMGARAFLEGGDLSRRGSGGVLKPKSGQSEKKEISSVLEHKITSEMRRVWLKGGK